MDWKEIALSQLLRERHIFQVFDEEFQKGTWLDVTALLKSECTFEDLYQDGSIPKTVLDSIAERIEPADKS